MSNDSFLSLRHVNVMRGGRHVLHDIHLSIRLGEQVAILGPNGCGKSTLLKTICCELYPLAQDETHLNIFGRSRWDLTELKKRLGVVQSELPGRPILKCSGVEAVLTGYFSSSTLWPHLNVTAAMREGAEDSLRRLHALNLHDQLFGEMSAGQQRRVLIARALTASAGCLLLDEPSNALDLSAQRELRLILSALAQEGITIVLISHNIADVVPEFERVILMKAGCILADGARGELLTAGQLSALFEAPVQIVERGGLLHAW